MSCILYAADKESTEQIDINELYDKEKRRNMKLISCFNKILHRVHTRIRLTSKTKFADRHVFYIVPEIMFGEPFYDKAHCIAYLTTQLNKNSFHTRYIHPNTLFVSWQHFVPNFIRDEIRNRTGMVVDSKGQVQSKPEETPEKIEESSKDPPSKKKVYKSTDKYKPTGNLVYNPELFDQIDRHVQFDTE